MKRTILWALVLLLPLLTACTHLGKPAQDNLDHWVDTELAPYLIEQFSESPRFKGKPLIIVGLENEAIRTDIDDVTRYLRDRLRDQLLSTPGIQLVRRQSGDATAHHRSLDHVICDQEQDIHYYLGLDVKQDSLTGKLTINVRALDAQNNLSWVSGFGKHYSGTLSEREQLAIGRVRTDEFLRGLRALPFSFDHNDLVANYLSHNLSCLLREHREGGVLLHVSRDQMIASPYFTTVFDLVENFVNRFNEVTLTDQAEHANTLLTLNVHTLNRRSGLHIVSASVARKQEGVLVRGMATQAYVQMNTHAPLRQRVSRSPTIPPLPTVQAAPVVASMAQAANESTPKLIAKPTTTPTTPITKQTQDLAHSSTQPTMIADVSAIVPRDSRSCQQAQPWSSGLRRIQSGESLRSGECFALELAVQADAYVQLLYQDTLGSLYRLIPSECDGLSGEVKVKANHIALYPSPEGSIPVIGLGKLTGTEKVYVIAARDDIARHRVRDATARFRDACTAGQSLTATRVANWEQVLQQLSQQLPGSIEWQSFTINHI